MSEMQDVTALLQPQSWIDFLPQLPKDICHSLSLEIMLSSLYPNESNPSLNVKRFHI